MEHTVLVNFLLKSAESTDDDTESDCQKNILDHNEDDDVEYRFMHEPREIRMKIKVRHSLPNPHPLPNPCIQRLQQAVPEILTGIRFRHLARFNIVVRVVVWEDQLVEVDEDVNADDDEADPGEEDGREDHLEMERQRFDQEHLGLWQRNYRQ